MVRAIERVLGSPVERRHVVGFDYCGSFAQPRPARPENAAVSPARGKKQEPRHSATPAPALATTEPSLAEAKPTRSRRRRPYWRRQGTQA